MEHLSDKNCEGAQVVSSGVRTNGTNRPNNVKSKFNAHLVGRLSIAQIAIGLACIVLMVILFGVSPGLYYTTTVTGYGIWYGALSFATGILGYRTCKFSQKKTMILSFMTMCIITAAVAIFVLMLGIPDAVELGGHIRYRYGGVASFSCALSSFIVILSLAEAIVAIICSVLCCKCLCRCCDTEVEDSTEFSDWNKRNPI